MKANPVIHIENLKVCYGSFVAVDGLNLELQPGELFGLLGPNGAGKSTTLRVLIGQRPPSGGKATVFGHDVIRDWADERRVDECLDLVELSDAADLPVRAYSLGMRRKLLLARALLHQPRLLYLDEPSANLDAHSAAVVRRILRSLTGEGVTVLLTTHNMPEVEEICDRVAILCRGRLVALDSPLALRRAHAERKADVVLNSGERLVVDLDAEADRD